MAARLCVLLFASLLLLGAGHETKHQKKEHWTGMRIPKNEDLNCKDIIVVKKDAKWELWGDRSLPTSDLEDALERSTAGSCLLFKAGTYKVDHPIVIKKKLGAIP